MNIKEKIIIDELSIDIPVFDFGSKSLRQRLIFSKVAKITKIPQLNIGGKVMQSKAGITSIKALDKINLVVGDGDRLAILGHNGSGKSTLLKVISGIYEPTEGEVLTYGRIMPLFNMMEGMAPDATGLETIAIRGAMLGLSASEIEEKTEDIVNFSDLGEFIDFPVRTYSSGMLVRLMFGIVTSVTASDIVIMDEFIGAGDATFLSKAELRLKNFLDKSNCLVVATHSTDIAKKWCNKAIALEKGKIIASGSPEEVIQILHG